MSEIYNVSCNVWTKSFLRSANAVHKHTYGDNYRIMYSHYHKINPESVSRSCFTLSFFFCDYDWLTVLHKHGHKILYFWGFFLFCVCIVITENSKIKRLNNQERKYCLKKTQHSYNKNQQLTNQNEAFQP